MPSGSAQYPPAASLAKCCTSQLLTMSVSVRCCTTASTQRDRDDHAPAGQPRLNDDPPRRRRARLSSRYWLAEPAAAASGIPPRDRGAAEHPEPAGVRRLIEYAAGGIVDFAPRTGSCSGRIASRTTMITTQPWVQSLIRTDSPVHPVRRAVPRRQESAEVPPDRNEVDQLARGEDQPVTPPRSGQDHQGQQPEHVLR